MTNNTEKPFRFRISLRGLLIAILVLGAGFGVLGRLFRQNPQIFSIVVAVLSSIVPYLFALGTIAWIGARGRKLGLCLWALLLLLIPFLGLGVMFISQRYAGNSPGNLGILETKQLIEVELPKQVDAPWVWRELEARLKSGKLSQEEAEAAVGQLIAHMKSTKPEGWDKPLSWQNGFLASSDKAGLLSDAVKFDLYDAFYGPDPVLHRLPRVREGNRHIDMQIKYGSPWSDHVGLDLALLWHVDRVLLDGVPIKVEQNHRHGQDWSGSYDGLVEAGEYELTVEMTCAYVDKAKLIGLNAASLPPARWPSGGKQWKRKVSAPLKVFKADETLIKLSADASLDPGRAIQVKRCVVQAADSNKKKVILELDLSAAISMSCDVSITLAGETFPLGSQWLALRENGRTYSGINGMTTVIESLDPGIEYADITLTPAPKHIEHRPEVAEIWGKPIILYSVPIERLDLELQQTDQ